MTAPPNCRHCGIELMIWAGEWIHRPNGQRGCTSYPVAMPPADYVLTDEDREQLR